MSVEKIQRDITDLFNYPSDQNPTTQQDYIAAVKNWVETIVNLVDCNLWQPETEYSVGNYLRTPSLPSQVVLRCVSAGISGTQEPDYTDAEIGDTIADGSIEWTIQTMASLNELEAYFAEIISRIENGEGIVDTMWETDLETDIQPITASNVVPKVNGTGTLGTENKKWANVYTNGLTVSGTATAVTPSTHDDSTKIATTEYVQGELSDCLPLSGGTMTGTITSSAWPTIKQVGTTSAVVLCGGDSTGGEAGAKLYLYGKTHSNNSGEFLLYAGKSGASTGLVGKPDGTLTWGGNNVITSAGGTMTGTLTIGTDAKARGLMAQNGTNCFRIASGEFSYASSGAFLHLFSQTADNNAGNFQLSAHDSSNDKSLIGKPDGTLTWGGLDITPQKETNTGTTTDVNVPSGSVTNLMSFTLTKGVWLVQFAAHFASNATGYRRIVVSTTSTGSNMDRYSTMQVPAVNGVFTALQLTAIMSVTSATATYYFNGVQNSGASLNVTAGIRRIRISANV